MVPVRAVRCSDSRTALHPRPPFLFPVRALPASACGVQLREQQKHSANGAKCLTGGGVCLMRRSASMCVSLSSVMKVSAQCCAVWVCEGEGRGPRRFRSGEGPFGHFRVWVRGLARGKG